MVGYQLPAPQEKPPPPKLLPELDELCGEILAELTEEENELPRLLVKGNNNVLLH